MNLNDNVRLRTLNKELIIEVGMLKNQLDVSDNIIREQRELIDSHGWWEFLIGVAVGGMVVMVIGGLL